MGSSCKQFRPLFPEHSAALLAEDSRRRVDAHLKGCASCRDEHRRVHSALQALRSAKPPPIADTQRTQQIQEAVRKAQLAPPAARFRGWRVPVGLLAVAAVALLVFVRMDADDAQPQVSLVAGRLIANGTPMSAGEAIAIGAAIEAVGQESSRMRLDDGSSFLVQARSRLRVSSAAGYLVMLESGEVAFEVARQANGRTFQVHTPEMEVRVVGTRFTVAHEAAVGTRVRVDSGIVEVRVGDGGVWTRLRSGDERLSREASSPSAGRAAVSRDEVPADEVREGEERVARARDQAPTARQIRQRLRTGEVGSARAMIREAQGRRGLNRAELAELAILNVEADLAEHRHAAAIDGYLGVHRRYSGTPQAETALFAAAQLALDHGGAARGRSLAQRYLRTYPRGRYAEEADALIRVLSRNSDEP